MLGLASHHHPTSYWDIIGRDNPRKGVPTVRREPRRRKTATGMQADRSTPPEKVGPPAFFEESDQPLGQGGMTMPDNHVYRIIQVAGSSENSIEDAIQNAVGRASRTLRQVGWFEVLETRGHVEDGKVAHYQVTLKVGFTLDDDD